METDLPTAGNVMDVIIGTDEAGYGPNYGPLVIAATRWEIDDVAKERFASDECNLRRMLESAVCQSATGPSDLRVEVADSKSLYGPGKSLARLERGVLAFSNLLDEPFAEFSDMYTRLSKSKQLGIQNEMLFSVTHGVFPVDVSSGQVESDSILLRDELAKAGVRMSGIRIRCVFPGDFNDLLELHGNKATLLSHETLNLVEQLLPDSGDVTILCDKHGGRSKYAGLLQHCLTQQLVQVGIESLEKSEYRWRADGRKFQAIFQAKGEIHLPIALASMVAKYVRESFMGAWNSFWLSHIPDLRPTAGYPSDARRFQVAIAEKQNELGIEEHQVWRAK